LHNIRKASLFPRDPKRLTPWKGCILIGFKQFIYFYIYIFFIIIIININNYFKMNDEADLFDLEPSDEEPEVKLLEPFTAPSEV